MLFTIYLYKCKTMKLTESQIVQLVTEEMKKSDVLDIVKKDKEFEKRIKEIASINQFIELKKNIMVFE